MLYALHDRLIIWAYNERHGRGPREAGVTLATWASPVISYWKRFPSSPPASAVEQGDSGATVR